MATVIPDTDDVKVAMVSAAIHLVYRSADPTIRNRLDSHLEAFDKAYKEIEKTVYGESEGEPGE
jgi:hypothetical protein